MNYRMDKYDSEIPELKSRTSRNKSLYTDSDVEYDKFDVNSNVSVLKNNAREIDVNQIRDMLDKKYRDNLPQRKSIDIPNFEETNETDSLEDTKEYDLKVMLNQAKNDKIINYDKERLTKNQNSEELINKINEKYNKKNEDTDDLKELIDTITALEIKNKQKDAEFLDLAEDPDDTINTNASILGEKTQTEQFYTGQLAVQEDDFEDFKDMQDDIKSNSIFVKILTFIFILILLGAIIFVANNVFDLGLF